MHYHGHNRNRSGPQNAYFKCNIQTWSLANFFHGSGMNYFADVGKEEEGSLKCNKSKNGRASKKILFTTVKVIETKQCCCHL